MGNIKGRIEFLEKHLDAGDLGDEIPVYVKLHAEGIVCTESDPAKCVERYKILPEGDPASRFKGYILPCGSKCRIT